MPRRMYDSDTPSAIPTDAEMVAGYIDGTRGRWTQADWDRFPNSVKVQIVRRSTTNAGHVLDVEPGIVPAGEMINWVRMRRRAGADPSVYCNQLNDWGNLRTLFHQANEPEPHWWVARYNNVATIPTGAVAKQYANPPLAGGHYDLSVVADYWPGVDQIKEEQEMALRDDPDGPALIYRLEALFKNRETALPQSGLTGDTAKNLLQEKLRSIELELATLQSEQAQLKDLIQQLIGPGIVIKGTGEITVRADNPTL